MGKSRSIQSDIVEGFCLDWLFFGIVHNNCEIVKVLVATMPVETFIKIFNRPKCSRWPPVGLDWMEFSILGTKMQN